MSTPWRSPDPAGHAAATRFLAAHGTLHDLLRAGGAVLSVVEQDEYTYDVVARLPEAAGALLVVFDGT